jgi:hypothetical protein
LIFYLVAEVGYDLVFLIFPSEVTELAFIPTVDPFEIVLGEPLDLRPTSRARFSDMFFG